jgi:hypothetical protein
VIVDLSQPSVVGRFVCVVNAPDQFIQCDFSLMKIARQLSAYDPRNPVHDENLAARELRCLIQSCNGVLYIPVPPQKRHRGRMLGSQQANDAQIQ